MRCSFSSSMTPWTSSWLWITVIGSSTLAFSPGRARGASCISNTSCAAATKPIRVKYPATSGDCGNWRMGRTPPRVKCSPAASSPTIPYGSAKRTCRASKRMRPSPSADASRIRASSASESSVGGTVTTRVISAAGRG